MADEQPSVAPSTLSLEQCLEKCTMFANSLHEAQKVMVEQQKLHSSQVNVASARFGHFNSYSGDKQSFSDYLVHFQAVCDLKQLNAASKAHDKKLLLVSNLSGCAL